MNHVLSNFSIYVKFFINLFALVNPIGISTIFISMTSTKSVNERNEINMVASFSVFIILCSAIFLGNSILNAFGISVDSFRIAGGFLVITIAMAMLGGDFGSNKQTNKDESNKVNVNHISKSIGVVPIALPLMAGPGAISSTILWSTHYSNWINLLGFSITIAIFALFCWLIFRIAPLMVDFLGQTGIQIITKIMGLLLMALGVEFIVTGIKSIFPC